jgi:hypothetical protein
MKIAIHEVRAFEIAPILEDLSAIMVACVNEGASIGYLTPFGERMMPRHSGHLCAEQ